MEKKTKIVFIYKGRYWVRDTRTLETLSAMAKASGYETALVYDQDVFGVSDNVVSIPSLNRFLFKPEQLLREAERLNPDWFVFLENPANGGWITDLCHALKNSKDLSARIAVLALSGKFAGADSVTYGEAEKAFEIFLGELTAPQIPEALKVDGPADLNALPLPDTELFSGYEDLSLSYMAYAGKGCSGNCSYCEELLYKQVLGAGYIRMRRPARVMEELVLAKKKFGMREIIFKDSVFTADKSWLKEFLAGYRLEIAVPFKCFGRSDSFDPEIAALLKESGCYCIEFGLQTFNERVRTNVLKRPESLASVKKAFEACEIAGLPYDIDYIFGLPGETLFDHIEAALAFSGLRRLNRIKCHNLVYYKNLGITEYALKEGCIEESEVLNPGDFFSGDRSLPAMRPINAAFRKLFKLYGLLGRGSFLFIVESGLWRLFRFLPGPLVKILELVSGLAHGDRRFSVYLRHYPIKVFRSLAS